MAIHTGILARRIPQTEELGGLQSLGSQSRTRLSNTHNEGSEIPGNRFLLLEIIGLMDVFYRFIQNA